MTEETANTEATFDLGMNTINVANKLE